jgi:hypothetical protein
MMMSAPRAVALPAVVIALIPAGSLAAQIDYRNLDRERPVATEDAYPVERHAFELLLPLRSERERDGSRLHMVPLEIEYGVFDNTQIGLGLPLAALDRPERDTEWGIAGLDLFGLYNFNTEGPALPALSVGADLSFPVGSLAGEDVAFTLRGIATRSWGVTRLHLNAARSFGSDGGAGVALAPRWSVGLAADRTLFRRSLLLVGELLTRRSARGAPVEVNGAIGARYQLNPTLVLDAGIARRLRADAGPDYDLTIGLSHAFGLAWLMPGRPR